MRMPRIDYAELGKKQAPFNLEAAGKTGRLCERLLELDAHGLGGQI